LIVGPAGLTLAFIKVVIEVMPFAAMLVVSRDFVKRSGMLVVGTENLPRVWRIIGMPSKRCEQGNERAWRIKLQKS